MWGGARPLDGTSAPGLGRVDAAPPLMLKDLVVGASCWLAQRRRGRGHWDWLWVRLLPTLMQL